MMWLVIPAVVFTLIVVTLREFLKFLEAIDD